MADSHATATLAPGMTSFRYRLRATLCGDRTLRSLLTGFLLFGVFWVPLLVGVWVFAFNEPASFWAAFVPSIIIGEVSYAVCFFGAHALWTLERTVRAAIGRELRSDTPRGLRALRGIVFLGPGIGAGLAACEAVSPMFGFQFSPDYATGIKQGTLVGLFNLATYCAIQLAAELRRTRRNAQAQYKLVTSQLRTAKLATLNAEIQPHFLNNALNSIASLIPSEPRRAEDLTVELAGLYGRVLAACRGRSHAWADELEICRSYLEIEQARFPGRLDVRTSDSIPPDVSVPALSLHTLVENAVKHGVLTFANGGEVTIRTARTTEGWLLSVEDRGYGKRTRAQTRGNQTALANCRERLALLYGDAATVDLRTTEWGSIATLVLPLQPPCGGGRA